jgi:pimeloyl-ACP methyl ester carboxylesterase
VNPARAVVLLPGLDGTGLLLEDLKAALERFGPVRLIAYPAREPLSYDELLPRIRAELPDGDFIVVGESFSGPLALRLALDAPPPGLKGVVLGASFARLDLPLKSVLAGWAKWVPAHRIPVRALAFFLLGRWATPERRSQLAAALSRVSPDALAARVKSALAVDLVSDVRRLSAPLLYLKASADRLIPARAAQSLAAAAPRIVVEEITAPHFLFQTAPEACAEAIWRFGEAALTP